MNASANSALPLKIDGPYPPCVVKLGDITFVVSGNVWVQAADNITLDDVVWEGKPITITRVDKWEIQLPSSKDPNKFYTITMENGKAVWCTCPGWMYHHSCRHGDVANEAWRRVNA